MNPFRDAYFTGHRKQMFLLSFSAKQILISFYRTMAAVIQRKPKPELSSFSIPKLLKGKEIKWIIWLFSWKCSLGIVTWTALWVTVAQRVLERLVLSNRLFSKPDICKFWCKRKGCYLLKSRKMYLNAVLLINNWCDNILKCFSFTYSCSHILNASKNW